MSFKRFIEHRIKHVRRRLAGAEPGFCRPVSEDVYVVTQKPVIRRPRVAYSVKRKRKPASSATLATSTFNEAAVRECVLFLALLAVPVVVVKTDPVLRQKVVQTIKRVRLFLLPNFQRNARWLVTKVTCHTVKGVSEFCKRLKCKLFCPICLEDVPRKHCVALDTCNHTLCKACLVRHLENQADTRRVPQCVTPGCQHTITMRQCQAVLHHDNQVCAAVCSCPAFLCLRSGICPCEYNHPV